MFRTVSKRGTALFCALLLLFTCLSALPVFSAPPLYVYFSEDFESDNGSFTTSGTGTPWEWGQPTDWPYSSASGQKCWGTNLAGSYANSSDTWLISPAIDLTLLPAGSDVYFSWSQAHHIEGWWDRCYAMYRLDGGSWIQLWTDTNSYDPFVWEKLSFYVPDAAGHEVELAWRLLTDSSVRYPGYFIDDISVTSVLPVASTGIEISSETLDMYVGDSEQLTAEVTPANTSYPDPVWSSADDTIATVDQTGLVTGVASGTVDIYATTVDTGLYDTCTVTVSPRPIPVTAIELDQTLISLFAGSIPVQLEATVIPADADNPAITWSSDREDTATVTDGLVTPVSAGTAIITVRSVEDPDIRASCTVHVTAAPVPVSGIQISLTTLNLTVGDSPVLITAAIEPEDASNSVIIWSSSDEEVATVVANSPAQITPVAPGTATITATTEDGGFTATCIVTVAAAQSPQPPEENLPHTGTPILGHLLGGLFLAASGWMLQRRSSTVK